MRKSLSELMHDYFYQKCDSQGWSVSKGYTNCNTRYDGPDMYYYSACIATLVPYKNELKRIYEPEAIDKVLFVSHVLADPDKYLEHMYGSKMTIRRLNQVERDKPKDVIHIYVPDEVSEAGDNKDVDKVARANFESIFYHLRYADENKTWVVKRFRIYWDDILKSAKTFLRYFPDLVTDAEKAALETYEQNMNNYFVGKLVDGHRCKCYSDWKARRELLTELNHASKFNPITAYHPYFYNQVNKIEEAKSVIDDFINTIKKFINEDIILGTALAVVYGANGICTYTDEQIQDCDFYIADSSDFVKHCVLRLGYYYNPWSAKSKQYKAACAKANIKKGDVVLPEYNADGTLKRFATNRSAYLQADMKDALIRLTAIALKNPASLEGRHIGPYRCNGAIDNDGLSVGCHKFTKEAIQLFDKVLNMPGNEAYTYVTELMSTDVVGTEKVLTAAEKFKAEDKAAIDEMAAKAFEKLLAVVNDVKKEDWEEAFEKAQLHYAEEIEKLNKKYQTVHN